MILISSVYALEPGKLWINGVFIPYEVEEEIPEEPEIPQKNEKNTDMYSSKEVFLISDKNWKDVLSLVPVTTWTEEDGIHKYPTLIYHEEDNGFDVDSIIYFMQQYNTEKVTVIGNTPQELDNLLITAPELGVGLQQENIQRLSTENYLSYWDKYKDVVYVEDNYTSALMASTYASLNNIPLIIQNSDSDQNNNFRNRNIICVNNIPITNRNCHESHNLEQLQQKYIDETNTDKIILVNPNDWDIKIEEEFTPEKSTNPINELYSKTSLAAPILASAKHEVILSTTSINYQEVDQFIENKINNLNLKPNYLTILTSPNAVDMSKEYDWYGNIKREEVDNHIYGNLDDDIFQELAVGRIFSLTISDISSYLSRDLFYDEYQHPNDFSVLYPYPPGNFFNLKPILHAIKDIFINLGFNAFSFLEKDEFKNMNAKELENKYLIAYDDHAWTSGGKGEFTTYKIKEENVWLSSSIIVMGGCGSCAFELAYKKSNLFCANLIRRGVILHYGATVDASATSWDPTKMFVEELFGNNDIGTAVKKSRNKASVYGLGFNSKFPYDQWDILIGDPTFNPNLENYNIDRKISVDTQRNENDYIIEINFPELNRNVFLDFILRSETIHAEMFEYPLGNNIGRFYNGICDEGSGTIMEGNSLQFSLDLPKEYKIKEIKDVEYIDSSITKSIKHMPVFDVKGWEFTNYFYYIKDENSDNTYYFYFGESLGGEPRIIKTQTTIGPYKYKIYLELEEIS